jgi:ribosomal protein S18 acetylase RimI-like enzyme
VVLKSVVRKVRYATLLLKIGGVQMFFPQLTRQIYSRDILFGLEKTLSAEGVQVESRLLYTLCKATEKDMDEVLSRVKTESKPATHELIERKWFYECGFHDCYIARTIDTGEICCIAWLLSVEDNDSITRDFQNRLPGLKKDELLLENCYTFEKYRGNDLMPSVVLSLWGIAKARGAKRLVTYVRQENVASLRVFEKLKFNKFEEIPELKLLFSTVRKHG